MPSHAIAFLHLFWTANAATDSIKTRISLFTDFKLPAIQYPKGFCIGLFFIISSAIYYHKIFVTRYGWCRRMEKSSYLLSYSLSNLPHKLKSTPPVFSQTGGVLFKLYTALRRNQAITCGGSWWQPGPDGKPRKFMRKEPQSVWTEKLRCSCGAAFRQWTSSIITSQAGLFRVASWKSTVATFSGVI